MAKTLIGVPVRLPDGSNNPEYKKRYQKLRSKQYLEATKRYSEKLHEQGIVVRLNEVRCKECRQVYSNQFAILNDFEFIINETRSVICNDCQ